MLVPQLSNRPWARWSAIVAAVATLSSCAYPPSRPDPVHLLPKLVQPSDVQPLDLLDPAPHVLPQELRPAKPNTFSVSVRDVPLRDFLFAVARDAKYNLDVHPAVDGVVTMNAVDQTLVEILDRLVIMLGIRYEFQGANLIILPDEPVLRHYRIDHLNLERSMQSSIGATTAIAAGGGGGGGGGGGSTTEIKSSSNNRFWSNLVENVRDLLRETDKILPSDTGSSNAARGGGLGSGSSPGTGSVAGAPPGAGTGAPPASSAAAPSSPSPGTGGPAGSSPVGGGAVRFREAASVIAHPESGLLSVRATHRQHLKVREFLDRVLRQSAQQVFIEATVVEVELFDQYQQGINWSLLRDNNALLRFRPSEILPGGTPASGVIPSVLTWSPSRTGGSWRIDAVVRLLESFGNARVLSSPRITSVNNQPSILKVTEDIVYFRINFQYEPPQQGSPARVDVSSNPSTVSVGLVLQVTPQIGEGDEVTMVLRPTLTSIKDYVDDPAIPILLAQARQIVDINEVRSRIPQIQTREMESIVRVRSGEVVVLGGLMREETRNATDQVPGASRLPLFGEALRFRQRSSKKSELVILLRPTVVSSGYGSEHLSRLRSSTIERAAGALPEQGPSGSLRWPDLLEPTEAGGQRQ